MSGELEQSKSTGSETGESLIGKETETKTAETVVEGEKKVEEKAVETKAETVEPLTAESIKIPEGMIVDEPLRDEFLQVMNNAELDPKGRAQALIDLQAKAMQAVSERGNKLWSDMQDTWRKDATTQFGAALEPTLGNISKLLDQFGGTAEQVKELRDVFTLTGAGNHPAMIRFLENIGKPLREGGLKAGAPGGGQRDAASTLYPNMPRGEI